MYDFFWLKEYTKFADKCVTFQLRGYSCHFPGDFLGDCYWAHHVHKSFYRIRIPSGGWTRPVLVWSRSADWVSCWCTSIFFSHQLHRHVHFLLSMCMTVVLLLEFNSLDVNVMDAVRLNKKRGKIKGQSARLQLLLNVKNMISACHH